MIYRIVLSAILFWMVGLTTASAQSRSSKLERVLECQSIENDVARLDCFDEMVSAFSEATKKGEIIAVEKETIKNIERDSFGFNLPSIPRLSRLFGVTEEKSAEQDASPVLELELEDKDKVETSTVKSVDNVSKKKEKKKKQKKVAALGTQNVTLTINRVGRHDGRKLKFLFNNGQIWEQTDSTAIPSIKLNNGKTVEAVISKGTLGSFFLRVNGRGTAIKVRRTR